MFIYLRRTLEPNLGNKHLWTKDLDTTFSLFNNRSYNEITWRPLLRRLFLVKLHISGLQFYWKWNNVAFKTFCAKGNNGMQFRYRHCWKIFVFLQMHLSTEIISSASFFVTHLLKLLIPFFKFLCIYIFVSSYFCLMFIFSLRHLLWVCV